MATAALAGIDDQTSSNDDQLTISDTAVIINEDSDDLDFRIESNGVTNAFFVDGGSDAVGIGVTPEADWKDGYIALQVGGVAALYSSLTAGSGQPTGLSQNLRRITDNTRPRIATGEASYYEQSDGVHEFWVGDSASADAAGTFTRGLRIENNGNLTIGDDLGIAFGTGKDWFLGADDGENRLSINKGGTQGQGTNEGTVEFVVGDNSEQSSFYLTGGEEGSSVMYLSFDQADDNADQARIHMTNEIFFSVFTDGSWDQEFKVGDDAVTTEHDITTATVDYAEFFEWKTELANDAKITEAYGLTVVLDNDKVRLAEAGEEADVLGVVRPNNTSAVVGGNGLYWRGRRKKNVWGEDEKEAYTQVNWHILNKYGNSIKHHSYMKDRIPQYELIDSPNKDDKNWHLLDSNFKKDGEGNKTVLVVPSTDEEKAASRYTERTTHRQTGKPLMRRIFDSSYDSSLTYVDRKERRKEWCIVGLLGQVPIRDTAIIPTSWKKMKNLESGIDLYFIK